MSSETTNYSSSMARTFRDALLELLQTQNVSLRKVAEGTGVSYEQLKKLKQAKSQSTNVEDAVKIAEFFNLTLDEFLSTKSASDQAEIVRLYNRLEQHEREFLLRSARGLAAHRPSED